ncbi:TPA: hypothetical protein N0F65_010047 [Lagenidium giganteum]|uniref:Uncharacterized protein n=1 Tax=Lagenidium giganteum TaxID=4803 RepID=A0AAV2ZAI5_9STRA|nr:TPA: hypothetical protein N0F65_010047 [Lagenidium giganteum]
MVVQAFLKISVPSEEQLVDMSETLLLFADTIEDEDNATLVARIGTHSLLLRLMEHESELIQEHQCCGQAAAQVVANCSNSAMGIAFPHRARQLGTVQRPSPLGIPLPVDARDNEDSYSVLIRQVPTRMTGQPKTGYLLWGAAFVLARWAQLRREVFDGKTVLEVGSGLGLGGVVAARYAQRTILTDYQDDTLQALRYNVGLNDPFIKELDPTKADVEVQHLDWDHLESIQGDKVDVIIASDIICEPSTAEGFLRVVRHRLAPNGVAYLMNANGHSRFGVYHLHDILAKSELQYSITPVHELELGPALLDTVSDARELSYEYYEIRLPPPILSTL